MAFPRLLLSDVQKSNDKCNAGITRDKTIDDKLIGIYLNEGKQNYTFWRLKLFVERLDITTLETTNYNWIILKIPKVVKPTNRITVL